MSSKNLEKVIQRAISDAAFRRQLQSNPEAALRGFKLTADEVTALRASDAGRLMSLGIDQRMSKAFAMGDSMLANRASVDGLSIGGSAIADQGVSRLASAGVGDPQSTGDAVIDPGNVTRASSSIDADMAHRAGERFPSDMSATRSANVDMDHRVGERIAGQSSAATNASIDQEQRAGERIAGEAVAATNANVDFAQRAGERITGDSTGGVAQHEPGSFGDPVRPVIDGDVDAGHSVVRDIAPTDIGSGLVAEDTVRSAVRDVTDVDLRGGLVAPVEGSPEAWAFQNAADAANASAATDGTMRSAVRDVAPTDIGGTVNDNTAAMAAGRAGSMGSGGEAATPSAVRDIAPADVGSASTYSGDDAAGPGYLANSDTDAVRAVRDVTDVDLRGTAAPTDFGAANAYPVADPDSAEAYSPSFHSGTSTDAFLSSDEASQYNAATADSSGLATDEGQLYNPADATTAIPEHQGGDAIGNTPDEPEITA
jgi:hypothetical protein